MADSVLCPCGEPLHYSSPEMRRVVNMMVVERGATMPVSVEGTGTWMVPRHYIALHGFKAEDLPFLAAQYGWRKVKGR